MNLFDWMKIETIIIALRPSFNGFINYFQKNLKFNEF